MRRAILLAVLLPLVAGCGPTREDRFAQYESGMDLAVGTLTDLYLCGYISRDEFLAFDPVIMELRMIRAEMQQQLLAPADDEAWWQATRRFGDLLGKMNAELRPYENRRKEPPNE